MTTSILAGTRLVWMMNKANWRLVTEQVTSLSVHSLHSRADQFHCFRATGSSCWNHVGLCDRSVALGKSCDHVGGGILVGLAFQNETIPLVD